MTQPALIRREGEIASERTPAENLLMPYASANELRIVPSSATEIPISRLRVGAVQDSECLFT